MNILFLTIAGINSLSQRGIYEDLLNELIDRGNNLYIASPLERKYGDKTHIIYGKNYEILKIKTLNLFNTNVIEKGIGQLLMEKQFLYAIEKYWSNIKFDLIIYSTPPITFNKVIGFIKKRDGAKSYLMLKDIFPQNAVDLGMIKKDSFIHKIFRKKEEKLYEISDKIGTMSPANSEYLLNNNSSIAPSKIELFPNSIKITDVKPISEVDRKEIFKKYNIPEDKIIFIYGGNLGKPQGIDFLLEVLKSNESDNQSFFLIVGNGTEYPKLKNWFDIYNPKNSKLISALPKEDYDKIIKIADIGLIFLDHRFTIPNFPSRLLSYLENSQPVICATDSNTDIGKIAEKEGFGFWCNSNDLESFQKIKNQLTKDSELRKSMGVKGYEFLKKEYNVADQAPKLLIL